MAITDFIPTTSLPISTITALANSDSTTLDANNTNTSETTNTHSCSIVNNIPSVDTHISSFINQSTPAGQRRSTKSHQSPLYLKNYHCNAIIPSTYLSNSHHAMVSLISQCAEPNYEEAFKDPGWVEAMN